MFGEVHACIGHAGEGTRLPCVLQKEAGVHCITQTLESEVTELFPMLVPLHCAWCTEGPPLIFVDWHASEGSNVKNLRSPQRNTESFGTNFGTMEDYKPGGGRHFMLPMKVRVKSGLAGTGGMAH